MSKTQCLYHIVFATKRRERTITFEQRRELYKFIYGVLTKRQCHVYRINGMSDHVHVLVDLHPTIALADIAQAIKQNSSIWLSKNPLFPYFDSWAKEFYGFSLGQRDLTAGIEYIRNQETHHMTHSLDDELDQLALLHGLNRHPNDLK